MTSIVRFDQRAFRKGVNDALTLAPLREAIKNATSASTKKGLVVKHSGSDEVKRGNTPTSGPKR